VVDNGSSDGTPRTLRESPRDNLTLLALDENVGIDAYNRGVAQVETDYVLILDDDARPDAGAVSAAAALLDARPDLAAVAMHPRHPESGRSEWRFAPRGRSTDAWPFMGCGNLVRRADWLRAGGYQAVFFLYRNDTDLALTLLAMGRGVHFNPSWVVWHDSPAAARKSPRWFRLATRNWVWVCKRHGRGATRVTAILRGWAWAHRLAGFSIPSHARVLAGTLAGLFRGAPPLPDGVVNDGSGLRRLLAARRGQVAASSSPSRPRHSA
jgi:GT2 family glycosyltransferase